MQAAMSVHESFHLGHLTGMIAPSMRLLTRLRPFDESDLQALAVLGGPAQNQAVASL